MKRTLIILVFVLMVILGLLMICEPEVRNLLGIRDDRVPFVTMCGNTNGGGR